MGPSATLTEGCKFSGRDERCGAGLLGLVRQQDRQPAGAEQHAGARDGAAAGEGAARPRGAGLVCLGEQDWTARKYGTSELRVELPYLTTMLSSPVGFGQQGAAGFES